MGRNDQEEILITQSFSEQEQQGKGRSVWAALFRWGSGFKRGGVQMGTVFKWGQYIFELPHRVSIWQRAAAQIYTVPI
jgi:hypothetical protein